MDKPSIEFVWPQIVFLLSHYLTEHFAELFVSKVDWY